MYSLIIYDTSNYVDFPIGGQLTSVSNFLNFITVSNAELVKNILLVGITTSKDSVGKLGKVHVNGFEFDFLPVIFRDTNLSEVHNSLRVEYLKGLFKYRKAIPQSKKTIHYIHTPEAYIQVKLCHWNAKTAIFSHGSFFNMLQGFRFYKNNRLVTTSFNVFLHWLLRTTNLLFVLDEDSYKQYIKYNKNVVKVNNSIVLPDALSERKPHEPLRLLFVGRLSKVKQIDTIIKAVRDSEVMGLTVVGDGEEHDYLHSLATSNNISFTGSISPNEVKNIMNNSDILVMNSSIEGKPMTIIEALGYALPVITTPVGGIAELVDSGIEGEYTDGTESGIREAITKITSNYNEYSRHSREKSKVFDYMEVNKAVITELRRL